MSTEDCFLSLGNASLISEALRHYQRLENETNRERLNEKSARKSEKQHRRHYQIKECQIRPIIVQQAVTHKIKVSGTLLLNQSEPRFSSLHRICSILFIYVGSSVLRPWSMKNFQWSLHVLSTVSPPPHRPRLVNLRFESLYISFSLSFAGFRSNSRSSSIQTSSLVGCIGQAELPSYAHTVPIESTKLVYHAVDEMMLSSKHSDRHEDEYFLSLKSASADNSKRANVIKEIYKTENDYLGHLRNLVDVSVDG